MFLLGFGSWMNEYTVEVANMMTSFLNSVQQMAERLNYLIAQIREIQALYMNKGNFDEIVSGKRHVYVDFASHFHPN